MSRRLRPEAPVVEPGSLPIWERDMNDEQLAVIRHEGGPLANFAGAGSGKTRALVHRVVRLVSHLGVPADRIFCVTFSRAGADEMAARCRLLGVAASVQTWHAFCGRVLREEGTVEGKWTVDDKDRAKSLVKEAMGYRHVNWKGGDLTKVRRFIGVCKANLWDAGSVDALALAKKEFGHSASLALRVFVKSQELVEAAQLLTFDDMLVYVARLFRDDEEARQRWAAKFDYVLQDEAQDANRAQVTLAKQLAKDHKNYMIVGDPGQAIYGFRGSSPAFLSEFPGEWDARVITMAKNYRSGKAVVDVANAIIREGAHRLPEDMTAERGVDGEVRVVSADTLDDEARELVEFCKARLAGGGSLSDVTVLFRLNAQSRALEEALLKEKMPYVLIGGVNFYERKEVKDLLAYLRLAADRDKEGDAVKRCINAPFRFLGTKFVEKVMAAPTAKSDWLAAVEWAAAQDRIQDRQKASAFEWVALVEEVREMVVEGLQVDEAGKRRPATAAEVLQRVVSATSYIAWLEKEEGEESIESSHGANVRELMRVAAAFPTVGDLLDFVEAQVKESASNKRRGRGDRCVTMMSVHRSKGLEWPVVWVVGCNDTILPHAKGDPEEERRLMYVAATRARDLLVVSHVREMATRVGLRTVDRSPYLDVFPGGEPELLPLEAEEDADPAEAHFKALAAASDEGADEGPVFGEPRAEVAAELLATPSRAWLTEGPPRGGEFVEIPATTNCQSCGAPIATHGDRC